MKPFRLLIEPFRNNEVMMTLVEQANGTPRHGARELVRLWGLPLHMAFSAVTELARQSGNPPSALRPGMQRPVQLDEDQGVRVSLIFLGVKPLRKPERMQSVIDGIHRMSREEASYWFARTLTSESESARRRALRALRIMLAEE
jgi:hypothetical protein